MGKPTPTASKAYCDEPEDAVSLHTTPDNYDYDEAPEDERLLPPSYDDSQGESSRAIRAPLIHHIGPSKDRIDHNRKFAMRNGVPQVDETVKVTGSVWDTDPVHLEQSIREWTSQPPCPLVYVMGTHRETTKRGDKQESKIVTDFRIVMHLQPYLGTTHTVLETAENGDRTYRGSVTKQRAPGFKQDIEVGGPKPTLTEWCHRYCASSSSLRTFRVERPVTGFDGETIRRRIEGLIRATSYRGQISVVFPVEEKNIDFYTDNRINQWRLTTWIRWVFYLTFLWIFAWPYLFFATKRWAVVRREWPFSSVDAGGNKRYTTISEDEWFEKWQVAIRRLVLSQYQGEASDDVLTGVLARPEDPQIPGTFNSGLQGLDQAAGLLSQGFRFANAMQNGRSLGSSLQGGWGYDT